MNYKLHRMYKQTLKALEEAYRKGLKDGFKENSIGSYLRTSKEMAFDIAKDYDLVKSNFIEQKEKSSCSHQIIESIDNFSDRMECSSCGKRF